MVQTSGREQQAQLSERNRRADDAEHPLSSARVAGTLLIPLARAGKLL
jgi:hypothetical protein